MSTAPSVFKKALIMAVGTFGFFGALDPSFGQQGWQQPAPGQPGAPAGVGVALAPNPDGSVQIAQVLPGSPADRAGLRPGDQLIAVDGIDVRQIGFDNIPSRVSGQAGTAVTLTVWSSGQQQPRQVQVQRAPLNQPAGPMGPNVPQPQVPQQPQQPVPPIPQPVGNVQAAPVGSVKFIRHAIKDPAADNVDAFVFLAPEGWQVQGGIVWNHQLNVLCNAVVKVSDPRTGTQIEWLPVVNFQFIENTPVPVQPFQNVGGMLNLRPITDPVQFVRAFWMTNALSHLGQARVVGVQQLPRLGRLLATGAGGGQGMGYKVRYAYNFNGQPWEEDVSFALAFRQTGMGVLWMVNYATTTRAPAGTLDKMAPVTGAVLGSAYFTDEWSAVVGVCRQLFTKGLQQMVADNARVAQSIAQYRAESQALQQQIVQERERSVAARAEVFRETLGGVETVADPYQYRDIQLPASYKDYWVNSKGEYILSDQTGFDPNVGSTVEWKRMQRINPMAR
jgi:hypothetical protein